MTKFMRTPKIMCHLRITGLILFFCASFLSAAAQVHTANYHPSEKKIRISFKDEVTAIDLDKTLIYYEDEQGNLVHLWGTGSQDVLNKNTIEYNNFRLGSPMNPPTELTVGIPSGGKRTYFVVLKGVKLNGSEDNEPRITLPIVVRDQLAQPPLLFFRDIDQKNRKTLVIQPNGITRDMLLAAFKSSPEKVVIAYDFADTDFAVDFESSAASLSPASAPPNALVIELKEALPLRPESYSVSVKFPVTEDLRNQVSNAQTGYKIPADAGFIEGSKEVKLELDQPERAKSEYYFEATFTSTGKAATAERTNVGIFGIHLKPTIKRLSWRVDGSKGNSPTWLAVRPLLESDFDTLPAKDSEAPNRTKLGIDFELGRNVGLAEGPSFLSYLIWNNGVRYDSDRDFKLQTAYWHSEVVPHFKNLEKDNEQTLRQFRYKADGKVIEERKGRQPFISAYHVRPSIGYQLGGITKRDIRETSFPSDTISRLLSRFDAGLEVKRVVSFGVENTYYFLENLPKRRHRNYLEARFEVSTGYLFHLGSGGLQSALSLKFQKGEQPPTFEPVNALSIGFKLFR